MRIRVLLFGAEAAAAGRREVSVDLDADATCAALKRALERAEPALRPLLGVARVAVNSEFAPEEQRIQPGDEVALIGMVSGG